MELHRELNQSRRERLNADSLGSVNALFFLAGVAADCSRIGDAFTPCLLHPLEQFVFIFEKAAPAENIALGESKRGRFDVVWGDVWKRATSRPRLWQIVA